MKMVDQATGQEIVPRASRKKCSSRARRAVKAVVDVTVAVAARAATGVDI
jgi:hypothetical protein